MLLRINDQSVRVAKQERMPFDLFIERPTTILKRSQCKTDELKTPIRWLEKATTMELIITRKWSAKARRPFVLVG
tara:strand:+ start:441 stop:665 length:225 start_codon:yes stop_codon:yes gene_type:complete